MGVLKPWAPSRSYGLVIKLNDDFEPTLSLHSRADGSSHGTPRASSNIRKLFLSQVKAGNVVLGLPVRGPMGEP